MPGVRFLIHAHIFSNVPVVKLNAQARSPRPEQVRTDTSESSMKNMEAILWAVQDLVQSEICVTAGIAPQHQKPLVEHFSNVKATSCRHQLNDGQEIFICVPLQLKKLEHLPLEYVSVR